MNVRSVLARVSRQDPGVLFSGRILHDGFLFSLTGLPALACHVDEREKWNPYFLPTDSGQEPFYLPRIKPHDGDGGK